MVLMHIDAYPSLGLTSLVMQENWVGFPKECVCVGVKGVETALPNHPKQTRW